MSGSAFNVFIDTTDVMGFMQHARAEFPLLMRELQGEVVLETLATEKPLVPVAVKKWTKDTVIGELRGSVDAYTEGGRVIIGPSATHRGYPYGVAVKRGKRWRGEPAEIGPRPFDEWTMAEMAYKINPMADRVFDRYLTRWS